jgi:prepilin-type N-terminal cleavage/methylation domain-containing protein
MLCRTNVRAVPRRRGGFTLLELAIALTLAALLVSAVIVGLRSLVRQARLERDVTTLLLLDERLRSRAERTGVPCELTIDLGRRELRWEDSTAGTDEENDPVSCKALDFVVIGERRRDSGEVNVRYETDGRSPPLVVRLTQSSLPSTWLAFSPAVGFVARTDTELNLAATR